MSVSLIDGHIDDDVMTDEQIIQAYACCNISDFGGCDNCPCQIEDECIIRTKGFDLEREVFNVFNRQKAEIERLKAELKEDSRVMKQALVLVDEIKKEIAVDIETAKAEAVKEFAKRLKAKKHECGCNFRKKPVFAVTEEKIDNLVKEMVGEG